MSVAAPSEPACRVGELVRSEHSFSSGASATSPDGGCGHRKEDW